MFNGSFNENSPKLVWLIFHCTLHESQWKQIVKNVLGLALSFEMISSSIRILVTRITVSIPNPKSNEYLRFRFTLKWYSKYVNRSSIDVLTVYKCPLSILLFSCGCVSWRYFIESAEADDTVPETHTHASVSVELLQRNAGLALGGSRHKHWPISAQATRNPDLGTQSFDLCCTSSAWL